MRWIAVCAALAFCQNGSAEELRGKVVSVADGDTITVLDSEKSQHKVCLQGIRIYDAETAINPSTQIQFDFF
jgi:endonuclease YncB( thermonuclease family)